MTLEQLQQQLDAIPHDDALPASTTRGELAIIQARRVELGHRITSAKAAMEALQELNEHDDAVWLGHLHEWRKALVAELLTLKEPVRDAKSIGLQKNLTLSIKCIDFGSGAFRDGQWMLENSRLGNLMRASGFQPVGAQPERHYVGTLPWHGSIEEVEARLKQTEKRRAQAQQQLDSALLDDDVREKQEAESKRLRDALNGLRLRGPNMLVQDVDEASLTPLQQEALAWARRASLGV